VRELVVQHLPHHPHRTAVTRVRVPRHERVDERRIEERGVVLPVRAAKRLAIEDRVVEIDLRAGSWIAWNVLFDEPPAEAQHAVVTEPRLRPIPGQ